MIRVLVVEDEPLIAEAHRTYVGRVPGFTVHSVVKCPREFSAQRVEDSTYPRDLRSHIIPLLQRQPHRVWQLL